MNKIFCSLTAFFFLFLASNAHADAYEKIYESFLKEDYRAVNDLATRFSRKNSQEGREVLYLQALSLLKLGKADEARQKLKELENRSNDFNQKASAFTSIGDSYYYEGKSQNAYQIYKESLAKYPNSDQVDYLRQRLAEIPQAPKPLKQMGVEEVHTLSVQVGSFTKPQNAEALASKLNSKNFDAYVYKIPQDRMYRVRVGHLRNRSEAENLEFRLKKEGYPTQICP